MPDTNVIISALLWPDSKPARALVHAALYHGLRISPYSTPLLPGGLTFSSPVTGTS